MLEKLGKQRFILAEGNNTVADIPRRKHVEFFAQATAGTAIVADRHHGAQVADDRRPGRCRGHLRRGEGETFETFEKSREAGAPTNGDNAESALARGLLRGRPIGDSGFHPRISYAD